MGAFLFAAIGLMAGAVLLLLRPWQRRSLADASMESVQARVYADQLSELDRDLAAGTLAAADHAAARDELQRRLLEDAASRSNATTTPPRASATLLTLAIALPLAASGLYALLGSPAALLGTTAPGAVAHESDSAAVERMVASLAARLERDPSDTKGWSMLARSYHAMGRLPEARKAFERIGPALHRDPTLLAAYADVLAAQNDGRLEGRPLALVKEALALDPDHAMALSLAATAAYKRHDTAEAARYWQRLLAQLPPDSDEARWLVGTLAEIGAPTVATANPPAGAPPAATSPTQTAPAATVLSDAASPRKAVSGTVSLAPALQAQVQPSDTVFVFARATEGSRMPLAVKRARAADLPLRFTLDDSMAMSPQATISSAREVRIEARVSRQGSATPSAGDLIGASAPMAPGSADVKLTIDRVQP